MYSFDFYDEMMKHMIVESKSAIIRHQSAYLINKSSIFRPIIILTVAQNKIEKMPVKIAFATLM